MRRKQMGTQTQHSRLSTKPNRRLELLPAAAGAAAALASELAAGGASFIDFRDETPWGDGDRKLPPESS